MTVAAIAVGALALSLAWSWYLNHRYGNVVHPDQTIPVGIASFTGGLIIGLAAIVLMVVVA